MTGSAQFSKMMGHWTDSEMSVQLVHRTYIVFVENRRQE